MSKILVVYFSASGNNKTAGGTFWRKPWGQIFTRFCPEIPYTDADLNWMDKKSPASSVEMNDKTFRPAISDKVENMDQYDTIFLGFPIWWYVAPTIVNTFLEKYDLFGARRLFRSQPPAAAEWAGTNKELAPSCPGAVLKEGKRFPADATEKELKDWTEGFGI